jgi:hypothetical protein
MSGQVVGAAAQQFGEADLALDAAREFYAAEQLRLPPLPRALAAQLRQVGESEWGTAAADATDEQDEQLEPSARDLTDRDGFVERAVELAAPAQVAFGYTGHGVSSWWMCYQLILPSLALFIRQRYGGPYRDNDATRRAINAAFHNVEQLIVIANEAGEAGALAPGKRLVVAVDDRDSPFWGLSDDPEHWQGSDDPIGEAIAFLSG